MLIFNSFDEYTWQSRGIDDGGYAIREPAVRLANQSF